MISFCIRLSNQEAEAILRSEGFSQGHGVRKSQALQSAEMKIIGLIQDRWNELCAMRDSGGAPGEG